MCMIKINLAPARFELVEYELRTFCLERIIYSTEPQSILYIMLFIFLFKKHLYIYIINK